MVTPHVFRDMATTLALKQGVSISDVEAFIGPRQHRRHCQVRPCAT
jgi:hypothetical protein